MSGEHDDPPPDEIELERSDLTSAAVECTEHKARSRKATLLQRRGIFVVVSLVVTALIYSVHSKVLVPAAGRANPTAIAAFGQSPPSQSVLKSVQLDQVVTLPLRDAALEQALAHDIPLPSYLGTYPIGDVVPIAWRPDGKVLAISNQDNGFTLRSTATGQVVKSVSYIERPPSSLAPPGAFGTSENLLLWSPNGTWLLLPSLGLVHVGPLNV